MCAACNSLCVLPAEASARAAPAVVFKRGSWKVTVSAQRGQDLAAHHRHYLPRLLSCVEVHCCLAFASSSLPLPRTRALAKPRNAVSYHLQDCCTQGAASARGQHLALVASFWCAMLPSKPLPVPRRQESASSQHATALLLWPSPRWPRSCLRAVRRPLLSPPPPRAPTPPPTGAGRPCQDPQVGPSTSRGPLPSGAAPGSLQLALRARWLQSVPQHQQQQHRLQTALRLR
jgi:hypothetical protein